jgi:dihydrofolate reductase
MTKISLIAAIDENYGLGKDNQLLCYLPADLKHFKQITMGKPIIMGRKTFLSIGKPLPGRRNIVLTKQMQAVDGIEIAQTLNEAINLVKNNDEIMIIGGESVFRESMAIANQVYLTVIHHRFSADVYFPKLDESIWTCVDKRFQPRDEKNIYDMTFYDYQCKHSRISSF